MIGKSPQDDGVSRGAYVHVPFCRRRCGYCNFTLVANRDDLVDDYLRAVEIELSRLGEPRPVDTLFCGGGTPTQLKPGDLRRLFGLLAHWFPLRAGGEFSVEANPEDVDGSTVEVLRASGVNRVSLGVQSFQNEKLAALERQHSLSDVQRCFELLRPSVESLAIDLIFAAPNESVAAWLNDLETAVVMAPNHVSTYGLTWERGTRFYARRLHGVIEPVPEESERQMYELAIDVLSAAGFEHYEVSNFAPRAFRCRHNENYWLGGEYYGVGPGAASFLAGERRRNHGSTTTYLRRMLGGESPVVEVERIDDDQRARERLVFGLRRMDGVCRVQFRAETGVDIEQLVGDQLAGLLDQGLLRWNRSRLQLTRRGLLVSDSLWPDML